MRCAITGATGLLGANLAIELLAQGHEVVATKRSSSKTAHLDAFDIQWTDARLGDVESLKRAFDGAEAVFHVAAAVTVKMKVEPWLYEANVTGTHHVIEAVRATGAGRLVHCSSVAAIGVSADGEPCDETHPWNLADYGVDDAYSSTKWEAQKAVQAAVSEGLDAVIVNPTYMIGPYDSRPSSGEMVVKVVKGQFPGYSSGQNNFVDVRDVARGMILAWEKGAAGELHTLGGHNLSYKEFFDRVAEIAGVPKITRAVPRWAARVVGRLGDLQGALTGGEPLLNGATVGWGYVDHIHSSAKAERVLGYTRSPIEPAIADAIAWFKAHGML